jgi:F0F1-type ATP synthase alpha subunit
MFRRRAIVNAGRSEWVGVTMPLETGIKSIDALIPMGRGSAN